MHRVLRRLLRRVDARERRRPRLVGVRAVGLVDGELRVVYRGNDEHQKVLTGREAEVVLNVTGREAFARFEYTDTSFTNVTGIRSGTTADSGSGYEEIVVRQDGTVGAMGAGVALVGSGDTIVGDRVLSIDGAARTIQLGGGEAVGSSGRSDSALARLRA